MLVKKYILVVSLPPESGHLRKILYYQSLQVILRTKVAQSRFKSFRSLLHSVKFHIADLHIHCRRPKVTGHGQGSSGTGVRRKAHCGRQQVALLVDLHLRPGK